MAKFFLGAITSAALIAATGPGLAADMPVKSVPAAETVLSWSGVYFGGHAGYAWANSKLAFDNGTALFPDSFKENGPLVGAQFGMNAQLGNLVVGGEVAVSRAHIKGSKTNCAVAFFGAGATCLAEGENLLLMMGRVGFAPSGSWLLYGTAGLALSSITSVGQLPGAVNPNTFRASELHNGVAYGAGLEYQVATGYGASWTLGVEYLHVNFQEKTHRPGGVATPLQLSADADIVRARLSIKLNPWSAPVVARY